MKIAVIYWSGTGNTEAMAQAVVEGARDGAEVTLTDCGGFGAEQVGEFITRSPGKPTLVLSSDSRPDYDPGAEFEVLD